MSMPESLGEPIEAALPLLNLNDPQPEVLVKVKPNDGGEPVEIPIKQAKLSVTIKDLISDMGGAAPSEIPVKVSHPCLEKIAEWLAHHKDDIDELAKPISEEERKLPELDEWEKEFVKMEDKLKIAMILAANLLDIKPLLDILCMSVAELVKGQSPEELRKVLERTSKPIPEDLSEGIPGIKKADVKKEEGAGEPANQAATVEKRKERD